ncbi:MAG: hypothetical protein DRP85_09355 [Candidatus Makaraimicrobium thalassicum]|nr:MAG: hypothetical protein DRP85_09355 [Candidatus Omnitrophota bacterium]
MNLAEGTLVLLGFIFILAAMVLKISGLNVLDPIINPVYGFFLAVNTCFLIAFVIAMFDKAEESR